MISSNLSWEMSKIIGIYQKTFGDQSEAACRNDHRDNVLYAFNWVLGGAAPATPDMHIAYQSVFAVAVARGAPDHAAGPIAAEVVINGNPSAYLNGSHAGTPYGDHDCHLRLQSAQCPLASPDPYKYIWTWNQISDDGQCSRWGVQIEIVNRTLGPMYISWLLIKFLNSAGFALDTLSLTDIYVNPESIRHLTESKDVCGSNRNEVDSVDIDSARIPRDA